MQDHRDLQRRRNRLDGNVVVRRSDTAGREDIVIGRTQIIHGPADRRHIVRHDTHFVEADALHIQPGRDLRDILVLRPPREISSPMMTSAAVQTRLISRTVMTRQPSARPGCR